MIRIHPRLTVFAAARLARRRGFVLRYRRNQRP